MPADAALGALVVALLGVAAFCLILWKSGIMALVKALSGAASTGVSAMLDVDLSDEEKEKAIQKAGVQLIVLAGRVLFWLVVAGLGVIAPVEIANLTGAVSSAASYDMLLRWDFIVGVTVAVMVLAWLFSRGSAQKPETDGGSPRTVSAASYSANERLVHAFAFSGQGTHKALAWIDDLFSKKAIASGSEAAPIFITSLARGGTTALLNAMHDLKGVATHTYRDMPFIAAPRLWNKMAGDGGAADEGVERAHGDGMKISQNSPEAFDEIFWAALWPSHYKTDRILPWRQDDRNENATGFLRRHFAKIVWIRRLKTSDAKPGVRYLSKNNANIARLDVLADMFPGADVVIALRKPAAHAASLMRQHQNFTKLHAEDDFSRRYMRDIGHYEFGALHKPLAFDMDALSAYDIADPNYWLMYWVTAFEALKASAAKVHIVPQDALREAPQKTMTDLLDALGLDSEGRDFTGFFRGGADKEPADLFDAQLLARANAIYSDLAGR